MALVLLLLTFGYLSNVIADTNFIETAVVQGNNNLAGRLYQIVSQNRTDGNFVICPLCVTTTASQLSLGASGETLHSLKSLMGISELSEKDYLPVFQRILQMYKKDVKTTEKMFNLLFITATTSPSKEFQESLLNYFNSSVLPLYGPGPGTLRQTFLNPLNESGVKITDDFHRQLQQIETDSLLKSPEEWEDQIKPLNYFTFDAEWEKRFSYLTTSEEPFFVSNDEILPVKMMRQTGHFHMVNFPQLDARAISLPYLICDGFNLYSELPPANRTLRSRPKRKKKTCKSGVKDSRLQLIILIPNSYKDGLPMLESKLRPEMLAKIPSKFDYKTYMDISFPKFRISTHDNWMNYKEQLGLTNLGSETANFTRLTGYRNNLKLVESISHVSFTAREKGSFTKSSVLKTRPLARDPTIVKIDHPFIGFVHDKKTDLILIAFRFIRPTY